MRKFVRAISVGAKLWVRCQEAIECLEIELLKKQKLSKALELVLQKSLVRNMESNEQ